MPRRSWRLRVEDTLRAVSRIAEYVGSMDFAAFTKDQRTVDAVLRNLEIIGEAARQVPDDVRARHGSVPWKEMTAMRNLLSHGYFLVDLSIVWKTIHDDLPEVEPALRKILDDAP